MSSLYKKSDHLYTYAEYCTWSPEDRWELIHGQPWSMSPAPNRRHQMVVTEISRQLANWLKDKSCNVFVAPFDVLLPEDDEQDETEISTIVQPDVVVYCDKDKLKDYGAKGAPDLVVEVLSPFTSKKDLNDKYNLYEKHLVKEYWVVDPSGSIQSFGLNDKGTYNEPKVLVGRGKLESVVLEGFELVLDQVFEDLS